MRTATGQVRTRQRKSSSSSDGSISAAAIELVSAASLSLCVCAATCQRRPTGRHCSSTAAAATGLVRQGSAAVLVSQHVSSAAQWSERKSRAVLQVEDTLIAQLPEHMAHFQVSSKASGKIRGMEPVWRACLEAWVALEQQETGFCLWCSNHP